MNPGTPILTAAVLLALQASALASDPFTSNHPEKSYPDNAPPLTSPGPYSGLVKQVQEKLHEEGFDAGPVSGDFGAKTQAALAQFQLARDLPASGMLDDRTLAELGVQRESPAMESSGDSAQGPTVQR
jgi:peptidoglycan hydrolase-like protein with peptidoglycan-binding domain